MSEQDKTREKLERIVNLEWSLPKEWMMSEKVYCSDCIYIREWIVVGDECLAEFVWRDTASRRYRDYASCASKNSDNACADFRWKWWRRLFRRKRN